MTMTNRTINEIDEALEHQILDELFEVLKDTRSMSVDRPPMSIAQLVQAAAFAGLDPKTLSNADLLGVARVEQAKLDLENAQQLIGIHQPLQVSPIDKMDEIFYE